MEDLIVRLANDLRKKGRNVGINETLDAIKALRIVNTKNDEVINHILEITIIKDFKEKLMTKNNKDEKKEEYNKNVLGKCIYGESNNTLFSLYSPAEAKVEPKMSYNWEREKWIKAIKNLRKVILAIEGHRNKKSLKGDINLRMTVKEETKFLLESPRIFKSIKKRNKAKAVLLCDVSGSMRDNQDLILSFSFYMKKFIHRCEIFFFSTKIKKVTRYFMKDNISGINLEKIIENFPYGGGTRIGESLNIF
ncbi:VWA domain-containing protein [Candidatus Acidianus copahuensis]|uniref:VWA domain-containing protein n=1 Tax=Candidatus Acidianus copahuensis TaxID=1160895 RepID=UPI000694E129|nr:VWA domain-containing protein [Candidatus Acidianus copahuensis]